MLKINCSGAPPFRFKFTNETRVSELLDEIEKNQSFPTENSVPVLTLSFGYPPLPVSGINAGGLVKDMPGLKSGDSVMVREIKAGEQSSFSFMSEVESGHSDKAAVSSSSASTKAAPNESASGGSSSDAIAKLMVLGFSEDICKQALQIAGDGEDNYNLAVDICTAIGLQNEEEIADDTDTNTDTSDSNHKMSVPTIAHVAPSASPHSPPTASVFNPPSLSMKSVKSVMSVNPPKIEMARFVIDADNSCLFRYVRTVYL